MASRAKGKEGLEDGFMVVSLSPSGFRELLDRKWYKTLRVGILFLSLLAVQSLSATKDGVCSLGVLRGDNDQFLSLQIY